MKNFFTMNDKFINIIVFSAAVLADYLAGCLFFIALVDRSLMSGFISRHAFVGFAIYALIFLAPVLTFAAWRGLKRLA